VRREAVMRATEKRKRATEKRKQRDARLALERASVALEYALRRPIVDKFGALSFQAPPKGRRSTATTRGIGDPISRIGGYWFRCPRTTDGLWNLRDMVEMTHLMHKAVGDLGS
jgi:hypothetical protein